MLTCHIGCGLGFIDEQEPQRIEIELLVEPALSRFQDVQATLLYRMASLFAYLFVSDKKAVQLRLADEDAIGNQTIAKLEKVAVPILADPSDDQSGISISLVRIAVAAEWTGRNIPLLDLQVTPTANSRRTHAETLGSLSMWCAPLTATCTRMQRSMERARDISADLHRQKLESEVD